MAKQPAAKVTETIPGRKTISVNPEDRENAIDPVEREEQKEQDAATLPVVKVGARKIRRFKILVGIHVVAVGKDEHGKRVLKTYRAGTKDDVIETTTDLLAQNSKNPGHQKKFAEIYEDGSIDYFGQMSKPIDPTARRKNESAADYANRMKEMMKKFAVAAEAAENRDSAIERMSVAELRKYAEDEEIDLKGATGKDDILKILRGV